MPVCKGDTQINYLFLQSLMPQMPSLTKAKQPLECTSKSPMRCRVVFNQLSIVFYADKQGKQQEYQILMHFTPTRGYCYCCCCTALHKPQSATHLAGFAQGISSLTSLLKCKSLSCQLRLSCRAYHDESSCILIHTNTLSMKLFESIELLKCISLMPIVAGI